MNAVWTIIIFSGLTATILSNPDIAVTAMLSGSKNAVYLALDLLATYGFWLGLMSIIERTGVTQKLTRILRPVVKKLFPGSNEETQRYATINISANLLGLGNSSTLMGIKAIESMDDGKEKATDNMIMLIVLSATSLQLIPSTVIGMRVARGSLSPTAFLFPCIIATTFSTLLGVLSVKIISYFSKLRREKARTK